jgi:hypothetical protein
MKTRTHPQTPRSAREFAIFLQDASQPTSPVNMLSPEYSDVLKSRESGNVRNSMAKGEEDIGREINRALRAQKRAQQIARRSPLLPSPRLPNMVYGPRPHSDRPRHEYQHCPQSPMGTYNGKHKRRVSFSRDEGKDIFPAQQQPARMVIRTAPMPLSVRNKENNRGENPPPSCRRRYPRPRRATLPAHGCPSPSSSPMSSSSTLCEATDMSQFRKHQRYSLGPTSSAELAHAPNKRLAPLSRFNPFSKRPRADSLSAVIEPSKARRMSVDQSTPAIGLRVQAPAAAFFSPFMKF